jgi:hypothetical protein
MGAKKPPPTLQFAVNWARLFGERASKGRCPYVERRGNFPIAVGAGSRIFVVENRPRKRPGVLMAALRAAFLFGALFHEFSRRFSGEAVGGSVSLGV